jgi:FMN-dependent NADH-azoreductase
VAEHFIDSYRNTHRGDTIETLNVWQAQLPEFDGATIDAKYAIVHGQPHSPEQVHAWKAVARLANHFKSADKYIVSLPMWNFGIPYKLKHYIDLLVQPGLTFGFTPGEGYKGLVTGKPFVAIYARGGAYGPGSGAETADHQSTYLKQILGFIAHYTRGERRAADETLAELIAKDKDLLADQIAEVYAWRGETDKAFEWLQISLANHDTGTLNTFINPFMRGLRHDARYKSLFTKIGFPARL